MTAVMSKRFCSPDCNTGRCTNIRPQIRSNPLSLQKDYMGKPVFLVGYMGSGKTTTGKKLARNIGYFFFDLDEEIEKLTGKTLPQIFSTEGE